MARKPKP